MATIRQSQPRTRTILALTSLIFCTKLCVGADESDELPTLAFETGEIQFPGPQLQGFYKCLCKQQTKTCLQGYKVLTDSDGRPVLADNRMMVYRADDDLKVQEFLKSGDPSGNFLCHPGRFSLEDNINCTRVAQSPDGFDRCGGSENCQSFSINLNIETCDYTCVNTHWPVPSLGRRTFGSNAEFEQADSCDASFGSENSHGSNNASLVAAIAVGWVLFTILLGLNIAYIVYRFRKSRQKSSSSNSERPGPTSNAYLSSPSDARKDEEQRKTEIKRPVPETPKVNEGYIYYTPYGQEPNDYNLIDEERVKPALPPKSSKVENIQSKLKQRPLPAYDRPKLDTNMAALRNSVSNGNSVASQERNSIEQGTGKANGYTVLEETESAGTSQQLEATNNYRASDGEETPAKIQDPGTTNGYSVPLGVKYSPKPQVLDGELATYNKVSESFPNDDKVGSESQSHDSDHDC